MHLVDSSGLLMRVQLLQNISKRSGLFGLAVVSLLTVANANAVTMSFSGTFSSDDQVQQYVFNSPTASTVNFSTDSYGGGTFNGMTTASGGFVPVLSVFNALNGVLIASDGGDGVCSGGMTSDAVTNMCDDASLKLSLAAGSYIVAVSEFFNVPVGPNISDGFLEQGQGNFTGATCGTTGAFYEADVAPCVQRTGNFGLDIGTVVPEPSTLWLAIPAIAFGLVRRRSAKA